MTRDLRYALRRLLRAPAFTAVVLVTLALGIGANTAIFSVVYGVLLRPLPFAQADRLVQLYTSYPEDETRYSLSPPDFMSLHDDARSFSGVVAVDGLQATLTGGGEPVQVAVGAVSERFFETLGVTPVLGRGFRPEENRPGQGGVAAVSHAFWRQQYGGDPTILGRTLTFDGQPRTVVGVLPPEFDLPQQRDFYFPIEYDGTYSSTTAQGRRGEYLMGIARLAPGVEYERAAAEVRQISDRLRQEFPETNSENITLAMVPLREVLLGDVRAPLFILLGAVGLVLLIACVNVANLLLARGATREGEMAVRAALGAGRGQLVKQLLTETVVLGIAGGALGLGLAVLATDLLVAARPEGIPRLDEVRLSAPVIAFTAALSLGTGLLFGLVPALQTSRAGIAGQLREGGRGGAGSRQSNRARRALVVAELALSVVLLVGAGLLVRSFLRLTDVDPGFRSERLAIFELSLPAGSYADGAAVRQFYPQLVERLGALPGVESATAGSLLPLMGTGSILGFSIENQPQPPPGFVMDAAVASVMPDYFSTLGVPLRAGRTLDERDRRDAPEVAVVNEAFVRRYFLGENPVGRRFTFDDESWVEIVGVVGDAPQYGLDREVRPGIYMAHAQFTTRSLTFALRTALEPAGLFDAIRSEIGALDPDLPVQRLSTGEQLVATSVAQPRFYTVLLGIFAAVALALAAVGIFGVMSFLVAQRTREIGVRIALGADPASVLQLVVGGALMLCVFGIGLGLAAALAGSRVLSGLLFETGTLDPLTYLGAAGLLLGVGVLASYLPARAATRVDPNVALRYD